MRVFLSTLSVLCACATLLGCKTLSEISVGYADAVTTSSLPSEGPWSRVSVTFPSLSDIDPLASPSLSRHEITPAEIESVELTSVELAGAAGECGLPFSAVELQLVAAELGPVTLASAVREGECLTWTLAQEQLAAYFRQPKISIVALVDGEPVSDTHSLSLRVSFLIDIVDKHIE